MAIAGRNAARHRDESRAVAAAAEEALPAIVHLLRERFGCDRIRLFGSLAWGRPDARSDLDIAVQGLDPLRHYAALAAADAVAGEYSAPRVDLLRMEDAPAALAGRIRRDGRPLDAA